MSSSKCGLIIPLLLAGVLAAPAAADTLKDPCPVHANHKCWVTVGAFAQPAADDWKKFEDLFDFAKTMAKTSRGEDWTRAYAAAAFTGDFGRHGPEPFNYCGEGGHGNASNKLGARTWISYAPGGANPAADLRWSQVVNGGQFDPNWLDPEYPRDGYDKDHPTWFGDQPCHDCVDGWTDRFMTIAMTRTVDPSNAKKITCTFDKAHAWTWSYTIHCVPVPLPASMVMAGVGLFTLLMVRAGRNRRAAQSRR